MIPKFRAWDKISKKMFPVMMIDFGQSYVMIEEINGLWCERDFDDIELMQYTGLHDVHGKEVFEGDLTATPFEEDGLFEVHMDTVAGVYTKSTSTGKLQFIEDLDSLEELEGFKAEFAEYLEIKGNIYENPDLLGEHGGRNKI
ncbi:MULTISPECIES: YopX family protein [Streptococcus]|uniref:YopX family protein n=1 Tax=Streptococcus TaxID=1301 RepID=UPI000FE21E65|nr:YopX family protein [Streptococcus lutetiensis]RHB86814.1 hypothetical protein DW868_00155 [Streptococcus lutetiensis]